MSNYTLSQGGAIYYEFKSLNLKEENSQELHIFNNNFTDCEASSGGAVLINLKPE